MPDTFNPIANASAPVKKTVVVNGKEVEMTPELEKIVSQISEKETPAVAVSSAAPSIIANPNPPDTAEPKVIDSNALNELKKEVATGVPPAPVVEPKKEEPVKAKPAQPEAKQEEPVQKAAEPLEDHPEMKPEDTPKEEPKAKPMEEKKEEKKVEEHMTPEQREIASVNNISNFASIVLGSNEELSEACRVDFDEDQRTTQEKTDDPSDYLIAAARATRHGLQNQNQSLQQRMLNALLDSNATIKEAIKELRLARVSAASYLKKAQDGGLSGDMGGLAVIAATQGTYRIILYNSGFHITMRPMTIEMANDFVMAVDRDFENLGRIIGGFYHLPMSVFLKQKINEFIPDLVVASNLKNWRDKRTLLDAISYNDYETILWALCTMLFKDGIGIGMVCPNKECRNHEVNEFIDLTKVCYLNLTKLNGEAVKWLMDTTAQRSLDDLKKYKEEIIGNIRRFTPKDSPITYVFKDPSLRTFVNLGLNLIAELTDAVNARTDIVLDDDEEEVKKQKEEEIRKEKQKQITIHLYKMLIPWIDHLEIVEKNSKEKIMVSGYEAIAASLEVRNKYGENLYEQIEDFIRDSRCAFYCVDHLKCPRCGKMINYNKNEMTALDIEYIFFCLSCLMLEQAGLGEA